MHAPSAFRAFEVFSLTVRSLLDLMQAQAHLRFQEVFAYLRKDTTTMVAKRWNASDLYKLENLFELSQSNRVLSL